jgi:hypothetical protein
MKLAKPHVDLDGAVFLAHRVPVEPELLPPRRLGGKGKRPPGPIEEAEAAVASAQRSLSGRSSTASSKARRKST